MPEINPNDGTSPVSILASIGSFFWELIKVFLIAVVIIVPIRYFLVQPFFVRGASMEPNFLDGQYLVVDELSYRFRTPERGEVIVFRYPNDPSEFFIKRIIGLPGDTVKVDNGQVIIQNARYPQGAVLDESFYLPQSLRTGGQTEVHLGGGEYWVMGDNRPASSDSRSWGPLKQGAIVGRVWVRAYPFDQIEVLRSTQPRFLSQ